MHACLVDTTVHARGLQCEAVVWHPRLLPSVLLQEVPEKLRVDKNLALLLLSAREGYIIIIITKNKSGRLVHGPQTRGRLLRPYRAPQLYLPRLGRRRTYLVQFSSVGHRDRLDLGACMRVPD